MDHQLNPCQVRLFLVPRLTLLRPWFYLPNMAVGELRSLNFTHGSHPYDCNDCSRNLHKGQKKKGITKIYTLQYSWSYRAYHNHEDCLDICWIRNIFVPSPFWKMLWKTHSILQRLVLSILISVWLFACKNAFQVGDLMFFFFRSSRRWKLKRIKRIWSRYFGLRNWSTFKEANSILGYGRLDLRLCSGQKRYGLVPGLKVWGCIDHL
jgi:hypothetical protein